MYIILLPILGVLLLYYGIRVCKLFLMFRSAKGPFVVPVNMWHLLRYSKIDIYAPSTGILVLEAEKVKVNGSRVLILRAILTGNLSWRGEVNSCYRSQSKVVIYPTDIHQRGTIWVRELVSTTMTNYPFAEDVWCLNQLLRFQMLEHTRFQPADERGTMEFWYNLLSLLELGSRKQGSVVPPEKLLGVIHTINQVKRSNKLLDGLEQAVDRKAVGLLQKFEHRPPVLQWRSISNDKFFIEVLLQIPGITGVKPTMAVANLAAYWLSTPYSKENLASAQQIRETVLGLPTGSSFLTKPASEFGYSFFPEHLAMFLLRETYPDASEFEQDQWTALVPTWPGTLQDLRTLANASIS